MSAESIDYETISKDLIPAIVNQKLAFARILLKSAKSKTAGDIEDRLHQHAFLDSALTQLHNSLRFFIEEVTGVSAKASTKLALSTRLPAALQEAMVLYPHSPELKEIQMLVQNNESWLCRLLLVHGHPLQLVKYFSRTNDEQELGRNASLIGTVQLSDNSMDSMQPLELVEHFLSCAQQLIERLRYSVVED